MNTALHPPVPSLLDDIAAFPKALRAPIPFYCILRSVFCYVRNSRYAGSLGFYLIVSGMMCTMVMVYTCLLYTSDAADE